MNDCQARQYSDQKHCERCGLTWDMNDIDPPVCLTSREIGQRTIDDLKRMLGVDAHHVQSLTIASAHPL